MGKRGEGRKLTKREGGKENSNYIYKLGLIFTVLANMPIHYNNILLNFSRICPTGKRTPSDEMITLVG